MSMITEQVEYLIKLSNKQPYDSNIPTLRRACKEAADTISVLSEKLQAANMERSTAYYNGGWIPVSERLPESDGSYLLFGKVVEDDTEDTFIGMYDACAEVFGYWEDYYDENTFGFLDSELIEYSKVIAWMPKPKPYREDGE